MLVAIGGQNLRHEDVARGRRDADRERMHGVLAILDGLMHLVGEGDGAVRVLQEDLTLGRGLQFSLSFYKNLDAEFLFQQFYVVTHRGLGQGERLRRLGKGAELFQLEQRPNFGIDHLAHPLLSVKFIKRQKTII